MSLSTSSPNITQDIKVSPVGKTIIVPQTITINSNNPHGIKLFISSKDDKLVPTKTTPAINTSTPISPVPGDISNPSILNMNSFGFALPNESDNPLSSNFSANNIYTSNDKNLKNTAKFSKLTNKHNPIEIYQNKSTTTNKQLTVYYGTKINSVIDKGTYTLDILYTLIPNLAGANTTPGQNNQEVLTIAESDNNTLELTPAKLTKAQGNEILTINTTINTNLNISNETINNKHILIEAKINNKPCTNIQVEQIASINGNEGNIIQTQNTEKQLKLTCTTPPNTPGKYNLTLKIVQNYNLQDTTPSNNINNTNNKVLLNINKNNAVEYIEVTDMQSFTPTMCKNMQEHEVKYVKDTRDNEIYTIAKLKDKKCWMIQNLRLKLSTSTTLTSADTDLNNITSWTPTHTTEQFSTSGGSGNQGTGSSWGSDYKADKSGFRPDNYNTHGVYYSHGSATANSARNLDNYGDEAPNSICPKGWRLPKATTNSTTSDFYYMAQHYKSNASWGHNSGLDAWRGSHNMTNTPIPNFQYSGYYNYSGVMYYIGSTGHWWVSTISNSSYAYRMYMTSSYINPRDNTDRLGGVSVRCILKEPSTVSDIQYMQDFTSQMCTNMAEHQTATLTDKRDNQQYTIAKLKDGKCWMTQNLRLKLDTNKTLTPADTDIASNWTPPRSTKENSGSGGSYGYGGDERWDGDSEGYKTVRSIYRTPTYSTHGVYYTHSAVTAQSANNIYSNGQNAPHSVCPKGWRLPTSSNIYKQGEFWNLTKAYKGSMSEYSSYFSGSSNSNTLISGTPSFPLSGLYYYGGRFGNVGSGGYFWSSTVSSSTYAYNLSQSSSYLSPHDDYYRYYGLSARCVAH